MINGKITRIMVMLWTLIKISRHDVHTLKHVRFLRNSEVFVNPYMSTEKIPNDNSSNNFRVMKSRSMARKIIPELFSEIAVESLQAAKDNDQGLLSKNYFQLIICHNKIYIFNYESK